jgi:hypothetical protein
MAAKTGRPSPVRPARALGLVIALFALAACTLCPVPCTCDSPGRPATSDCGFSQVVVGDWWARTFRIHADGRDAPIRRVWGVRDGVFVHSYFGAHGECIPRINDTPANAIKALIVSLATQDTAALARVLAADYRYLADDRVLGNIRLDRLAQLDSIAHVPRIRNHDPKSHTVPGLGAFCEFSDSATACAPAPAGARARVECAGFSLTLTSDIDRVKLYDLAPCAFTLVRGDSARLVAGQPRDRDHWYVVEWHMNTPATQATRFASSPGAEGPAAHRPELAAHRISPLGEQPVTFELTLPSPTATHVQVFDVVGRRVLDRTLVAGAPGPRDFVAPDLSSGMYWIRVTQGGRDAVERFVVLH